MKFVRYSALALTALSPIAVYAQEAPAEDDNGAEEIIVTARKFSENLQNAPTSVAVVTAASIDRLGLDSIQDLSKTTSGLIFDDSFGRDANRPVIRGQANILGQSGVAFFIDGIYYSGSIADYDVDSIERVEVVKGPQSALYGRNTYSGAINIISKSPGETWEGKVSADVSENKRYDITAGIRGPIAEGLGIAIGGRYFDNAGEFRNAFDGTRIGKQSTKSVYGLLKYDTGGAVRATLRANYTKTDDGQPAIFSQSANDNNCLFDNGTLYRGRGRYFCGTIRPQQVNSDYSRQFVDRENVGLEADTFNGAFRVDFDITDNLTLTSLTGYNKRKASNKTDGDYSGNSFNQAIFASVPSGPAIGGTPPRTLAYGVAAFPPTFAQLRSTQDFTFSNDQRTSDFSQELKLRYDTDSLKLLIGGYYFRQNDDTNDNRVVPGGALALAQANANAATAALCVRIANCGSYRPIAIATTEALARAAAGNPDLALFAPSRNINNFDIENRAVFGSVSVKLAETFSISAEGRYAEESILQVAQTFKAGDTTKAITAALAKYKKFTPRITMDWQATPNHLLYGVYSEGQKPGGFNGNLAIAAGLPIYDAETVESFELGSKNRFLDGALTANFAVYRNKISGYQLTQNVFAPPNAVSAIVNAGDARVTGVEVELSLRPSRNFTVTANYALANAKFTRGLDENQGVLNDVADDGLVNCSLGDQFPLVSMCQSAFGSIAGKRIPRAPQHSVFFDVDYRQSIGSGDWKVFAGANVNLISSSFAQVHNLAKTGGSVVTDARLGVENGKYKVHFYVKNLFNEDSIAQIIRYADSNNDLRRNFIAGLRPGRRIGLILTAGF